MNILYYDCFAGISGDMHLAALIDLGVDKTYLISELRKLNISSWEIQTRNDNRKGIFGTRLDVILSDNKQSNTQTPIFNLPGNILAKAVEPHEHHDHRGYKEIKSIIENSQLSDNVKMLSLKIFLKIGEAEAKIHNKTLDQIHFHEVGAIDSIIDIVGAAICIDYLKPDKIIACPIQLGGGMVKCAHGLFPVPAPATTEILKGIPVKKGLVAYEATTPTGAAILASVVQEWTEQTTFTIEKTAYGIGHKDGEIPNVLRVHWAKAENTQGFVNDTVAVIECNIDDMNPEWYENVTNQLFLNGALDVYHTPIVMKKMRPATLLSVICKPSDVQQLSAIMLSYTTTLGVRHYLVKRNMLAREMLTVETQWGKVRVKKAILPNQTAKYKPEYDDCMQIATQNKIPLNNVYNEVIKHIS